MTEVAAVRPRYLPNQGRAKLLDTVIQSDSDLSQDNLVSNAAESFLLRFGVRSVSGEIIAHLKNPIYNFAHPS